MPHDCATKSTTEPTWPHPTAHDRVFVCRVVCCAVSCVVLFACGGGRGVCMVKCGVCAFGVRCVSAMPPCVQSKRLRVYQQCPHVSVCTSNAHMLKAFGPIAGTHGDVLNRHTEVLGGKEQERDEMG